MPSKSKFVVKCNIHGRKLTPPYHGDDKVVEVSAPKGKKILGCPICRREANAANRRNNIETVN